MDLHRSALIHNANLADIEHAVRNAITIDDLDDNVRLYVGPRRDGTVLEIISIQRADRPELIIHAMIMRLKYQHLLPGGRT